MKKIHALTFLSCAVAVAFAAAINAFAQNQGKAQVMILGVYHFDNPNQDYAKTDFDNHLSEKRQKQIAEVLESLAKFKPTKVVVEVPPEAVKVQQRYESYLKGEYNLTANEIEQLGFRLAKQFDHKQVYLGDHKIGAAINSSAPMPCRIGTNATSAYSPISFKSSNRPATV